MHKTTRSLIGIALLAATSTVLAEARNWTFFDEQPNSPRVLASYQDQCNEWADKVMQLTDAAARDAYLGQCMKAMPHVRPVGLDPKDD